MHSEWVDKVDNTHTYNNLMHNSIGTQRPDTFSSFYAGIEYDVCSICAKWLYAGGPPTC